MAKQFEVYEIVKRLIGGIEPFGSHGYDMAILENVNPHGELAVQLVKDLASSARNKDRCEDSMRQVGRRSQHWLEEIAESHPAFASDAWISIDDAKPEGEPVDFFNPAWIDADFNPHGIREGYRIPGEEGDREYVSAAFVPMQDCWTESSEAPTHWRPRSLPAFYKESENAKD